MQALYEEILRRLSGMGEVYPSFDAVPAAKKSNTRFTVVAPESVQLDSPFPDGRHGAVPFTAVYAVYVLIPMTEPLETAEDFFYGEVLPRMETLGSVLCTVKPAHADIRLGRVVMEGTFKLRGVYGREGAGSA